ncbi:unnamed protein product [Sphenostylis stenocarpa]|uniref:Uncharacterized protein n=1 Tax=Sphenostylis stenocarpa TaxID=92480 RepID=A0AA86S0M9_9FABA|nr:unnamed protein product [Sphenostylis stenocarpa]
MRARDGAAGVRGGLPLAPLCRQLPSAGLVISSAASFLCTPAPASSVVCLVRRLRAVCDVIRGVPFHTLRPSFLLCAPSSIPHSLSTVSNLRQELEMSVSETSKKNGAPQIVKLDKALKLAELWVNNMSKDADDHRTNADLEGRPSGLGLGAKVSRQSKFVPSDDPVEMKLYAKLNTEKRKAANIAKESATIASGALDDYEDSEDVDSRTNAFTKRKATVPLTSSILRNKKQK